MEKLSVMSRSRSQGTRGYDSNRSILNPRPIKLNIIKKYIQFYNSFLVFTLKKYSKQIIAMFLLCQII